VAVAVPLVRLRGIGVLASEEGRIDLENRVQLNPRRSSTSLIGTSPKWTV